MRAGRTAPSDTIQINFFAAKFYKGYLRNEQLEDGERVGVVTMTKKVVSFLRKNGVTPSVTLVTPLNNLPTPATTLH